MTEQDRIEFEEWKRLKAQASAQGPFGHRFDHLTQTCSCGVTMSEVADARKPRTHDEAMNPGQELKIAKIGGREIPYWKDRK